MDEELEIILRAVDDASSTFQSIGEAADELGQGLQESTLEGSEGFDDLENSAEGASGSIQDIIDYCNNVDGSNIQNAAGDADTLEQEANEASQAIQDMNASMGIIESSMILQLAEQVGALGSKAEDMAQDMNTAAISVGQLATQTGIAEPQMVSLVNTISNATFPNDEAMMYIKSLDQMGVASENLGASATNLDKINDAFGMGAQTVNSLGQELGVLGVDMNNVSSAFNALAYANANTVGGMENYYNFLRKYDSQFKELGYNVDQASVIIAAATQKFGGGRAALSGLSKALEEAGNDSRALEEALGMQAGSIENATQLTGEYEGQLQKLADEEAEHKTLLDQLGAAWEDLSLSLSPVLEPLGSAIGLIGEMGSFGLQVGGLKTLGESLKGTVKWIKEFNAAETIRAAIAGDGAIASIANAVGITAEAGAAEGATVAFGGLAVAEGAALWPILAIIAAIAALIFIVYEVGKAFGWWNDIGSMIDAIKDGVMRLWEAFINHPDVQSAIKAIGDAFNWIVQGVSWAGQEILKFFGISTGSNWDIVASIISTIGAAWDGFKAIVGRAVDGVKSAFAVLSTLIGIAVGIGQGIYNALKPIVCILLGCSPGIVPALQQVYSVFVSVFNAIAGFLGDAISTVLSFLQPVIDVLMEIGEFVVGQFMESWNAFVEIVTVVWNSISLLVEIFQQFMDGQISLTTMLTMIWNVISTMFATVLSIIIQRVISFGSSLVALAISIGGQFVQNIINFISQLPGNVWNFLLQTTNRIINAGSQWVSNARNKANQVLTGVISFFSQLPGKALSVLLGVVSSIVSAGSQWVSNARSKASEIVSGVVGILSGLPGKISSALSGVVNAIVQPFKSAYDGVVNVVNNIKNKVQEGMDYISSLGGAAGGDFAAGGDTALDLASSNLFNINTGEIIKSEETINVNIKEDITLDLANVPSHIDTKTLSETIQDKEVLRALTSNRDFQDLDAKVKERINLKINRGRGI